jgi:hypothetical protein
MPAEKNKISASFLISTADVVVVFAVDSAIDSIFLLIEVIASRLGLQKSCGRGIDGSLV